MMKAILSSRMRRQLEIVELLFERKWLPIHEITEKLSVPAKTIKSDLIELESLITPATLKYSKQYGVTLSLQSNVSKATIFKRFLHNSTEFQLLETIFLHSFDTAADLADSLFISLSTVKRMVSKINQSLQLEGFTIQLKKMQLIGDPHSICYFMKSYFLEKYYTAEQLLSSEQLTILDQAIAGVFNEAHPNYIPKETDFALLNRLRISAYTVILLLTRNSENQLPHLPEKKFEFLESKTLCDNFYKQFQLQLSSSNVTDMLYLFFNERYVYSKEELLTQIKEDYRQQQKYDKLNKLLQQIEKEVQQTSTRKDELLLLLYNLDNQIHSRTFILYNQNKHFFLNLKNMYGSFIQELIYSFQASYYASPHKEYIVYEALRILFMIWPELFDALEKIIPKLKAGLFFTASPQYNKMIAEKLNYHFKNHYEFTPINVHTIAELSTIAASYDCIITNIPDTTLDNTLVVVLPISMDPESYDKLMMIYEEYIEEK